MSNTTPTIDWNDTIDWGLSPRETIWSHSSSSSNSNSFQSPNLMRYSEASYINTPVTPDRASMIQDTPKRANSLYKSRQILGEVENLDHLKPIWEDNLYYSYYNNPANYFWTQQAETVYYPNDYQRRPNNDNLSFYDQLLRDENDPYQRELNVDTEADLPENHWNLDLFNKVHNQERNKQFDHTVGRPILKSNVPIETQSYDSNSLRSSVFASTPIMPEVMPVQDFGQFSSTDGYKICTFCKKNGERPSVYTTHAVRAKVGRKYIVTCPILRKYACVECGATGDNSHTISYCPLRKQRGDTLPSTTMSLKKTKVKSNGQRRY